MMIVLWLTAIKTLTYDDSYLANRCEKSLLKKRLVYCFSTWTIFYFYFCNFFLFFFPIFSSSMLPLQAHLKLHLQGCHSPHHRGSSVVLLPRSLLLCVGLICNWMTWFPPLPLFVSLSLKLVIFHPFRVVIFVQHYSKWRRYWSLTKTTNIKKKSVERHHCWLLLSLAWYKMMIIFHLTVFKKTNLQWWK